MKSYTAIAQLRGLLRTLPPLLLFLLSISTSPALAQVRTSGGFNIHSPQFGGGVSVGYGSGSPNYSAGGYSSPGDTREISGGRIGEAAERILQLLEGNLGSLIMVAAGLGTIVSAAFGAYRAAISLLVVAVGSFVLRTLIRIFFDSVV